ncbi:MAG: 16S rRNA (uracil(1498)-N(3))-methyltransferase [Betaproteobacteria bacterium]|nr:16S rRNA (uracil(1498)-N(3))-methyltransferase [Betaproteobacteria bacterium]
MALPRFYIDVPLVMTGEYELPPAVAHHALKVLRLKTGDALVLFDGTGGEHLVRVSRVVERQVTVTPESFQAREAESPLSLWLGQSLCATDKMDWILQKAVELGVSRCSPLQAERSVVRLDEARAGRRLGHWQSVIEAACEQSGRNRIPRLDPVQSLRGWLAQLPESGMRLMLSPRGDALLETLAPPEGPVILLVGPEGGLSEEEERAARNSDFLSLRLGPRILRTETAALALVSALQARWGDFVEERTRHPL